MEKGFPVSKTNKTQPVSISQIADELDIQEKMIDTLAEMLEEKGIIRLSQWEKRTQSKLHSESKG
jgi:biotin operon repressor